MFVALQLSTILSPLSVSLKTNNIAITVATKFSNIAETRGAE
jgi:hypothetical protein